jgi:hypothetical protein
MTACTPGARTRLTRTDTPHCPNDVTPRATTPAIYPPPTRLSKHAQSAEHHEERRGAVQTSKQASEHERPSAVPLRSFASPAFPASRFGTNTNTLPTADVAPGYLPTSMYMPSNTPTPHTHPLTRHVRCPPAQTTRALPTPHPPSSPRICRTRPSPAQSTQAPTR